MHIHVHEDNHMHVLLHVYVTMQSTEAALIGTVHMYIHVHVQYKSDYKIHVYTCICIKHLCFTRA